MTSYPCNKYEQITPSYRLSVNYETIFPLHDMEVLKGFHISVRVVCMTICLIFSKKMAQNHSQENFHFSAAASDMYFHKSYALSVDP